MLKCSNDEQCAGVWTIALAAAVFAALSFWAAVASRGFLEADACTHYLYARFAFEEPHYFVNVWGRPLCTGIYAIPAVLGGRLGVRGMSLVLALVCAAVTYRIAKGQAYRWPALAFVFTLAQPLVFLHSFSELTELPFATLIGLAFWMYQKRWWGAMALLVGLSPLGRPEGFGFMLMAAAGLVLHRKFLWLLALPIPLLLWNHAGWELFGRPGNWWMWLPDNWPYAATSLYDRGYLVHFLVLLPVVTSPFIFPAMVIGAIISLSDSLSLRERAGVRGNGELDALGNPPHPNPLPEGEGTRINHLQYCQILIAIIPFGVLAVHSLLYWLGKMASNGELRYLLAVAPFWALLSARGWEWFFTRFNWKYPLRWAAVAAMAPALVNFAWRVVPIVMYDNDLLGEQVAQWYRSEPGLSQKYPRIIAASPTIYYSLDISITSRDRSLEMNKANVAAAPPGTFLVWDPVFGPYNSDVARVVLRDEVIAAGWIPCHQFQSNGKTWEAFLSPRTIAEEPTPLLHPDEASP